MKYVMGTVTIIILVIAMPIMVIRVLSEIAQSTAQAELARGQAAAMVEQARAQGDLMRAQANITNEAAQAVAADRHAAHGASSAQVALVVLLVAGGVALIAWLWWRLRLAEAQLRAVVAVRLPEEQAR